MKPRSEPPADRGAPVPHSYEPVKRLLDVVISLSMLILFSVPMIFLAVLVRADIGSPVLFRQERPGRYGRPFTMLKFRTMRNARNPDGDLLPDRQRLTRFGRFLRATSLDELPELINVLRGEMSLVGPRPLLMRYMPFFTREELRRLDVLPGVTGWAQVNGRNTLGWDERLAHDVWYAENMSLKLDLRILWMTLVRVALRADVVVDSTSTLEDLDDERRDGNHT